MFEAIEPFLQIIVGVIEDIGRPVSRIQVRGKLTADNFIREVKTLQPQEAISTLLDWIEKHCTLSELVAVGHRIVHGGPKYNKPQKITNELIAELRRLSPFDPEHLPEEILLLEAFQDRFPNIQQVACFDTAFHHELPRVAQILPIPRSYEAKGIRRYGFHGLSYQFLMEELARLAGPQAAQGRVILAHLGNGASLAAVHAGKSIDTSMSFTPTSGLPMSNRSGDLDPGLIRYLTTTEQMTPAQFSDMVNFKSGLLGISETSSDMRELLKQAAEDVRADEAVELFCYQVKKWIGAYAAALGGLDTLIFSGGIGENSATVRSKVCAGLEFLGIQIEEKQNKTNAELISFPSNNVAIRVMRTNEELVIAKMVSSLLASKNNGKQD